MKMHVFSIQVTQILWSADCTMVISQSALKCDWIIICGPVRNFFGDDFDLCSKIIALDQKR